MNELKKADEVVGAMRDYASDCDDCCDCFQCDFACVCGKFDYNAPKIIADLIESLTAQLAESQRREKAAVELIRKIHSVPYDGYCKSCGEIFDMIEAAGLQDDEEKK